MKGLVAALALTLLPGVAAAQVVTYQGRLRCERLGTYTTGPLNVEFAVRSEGGRLSYTRPVQDRAGGPTPYVETGGGTLGGDGRVVLHGNSTGRGWRYEATYEGIVRGNVMVLSGHQLWSPMPTGGEFDRACQARLVAAS